jgi:hypothetical protein
METLESTALEPAANGHPGITGDEAIIAAIEQKRVALHVRAEELKAELATITPELKRYEKAIAAIRGEPLGNPQKAKAGPGRPKGSRPIRGQRVSEAALERTWAAILQLTEDADEFTQTQVRAITADTSGVSSLAFEAMRQEGDGRIRFARQAGQHKYYRLSQSAIEEREEP